MSPGGFLVAKIQNSERRTGRQKSKRCIRRSKKGGGPGPAWPGGGGGVWGGCVCFVLVGGGGRVGSPQPPTPKKEGGGKWFFREKGVPPGLSHKITSATEKGGGNLINKPQARRRPSCRDPGRGKHRSFYSQNSRPDQRGGAFRKGGGDPTGKLFGRCVLGKSKEKKKKKRRPEYKVEGKSAKFSRTLPCAQKRGEKRPLNR